MDTKSTATKMLDSDQSLQEAGIVVDAWGNIDVAYYEAKAVDMRSEYLTQMFASWRHRLAHNVRAWFRTPVARNA